MLEKKIGFIGGGNMAKTIISALVKNSNIIPTNIWVYDRKLDTNKKISQQYGITAAETANSLASEVDILLGTVKPNIILNVFKNLSNNLKKNTLIVSIAPGVTLKALASVLGKKCKIIRIMPNIPLLINQGMISVTPNKMVEKKEVNEIIEIFEKFGKTEIVSEDLIHTVVGISASAPAYVFMFIEAMADAAVLGGMPRDQAYRFAVQTVQGSAQMIVETGKHPGELKDIVCSPAGTTITAVKVLEEQGFRAAVIKAIQQCIAKSETLTQ
ncbi:pyrroline-5-carboxylate reductase [Candidatus Pantoea carbekii]|uniref:Pyrroline-5-carboxylate reductase n=1 Tax=Candidatus Pantoea carbekii TaxID=1235990 RepID=U3U9U6_9GAMM|nr:pyrroline-5-carboxylate reductase [Candidatus Pantoea carbekii]AKC32247.1 pyrroline-5-carboxylate reductase ProC [Candidatus Pantoea carbekii]BAO00783.1 ProC protein [Candidatus Pantoea carbekii]